MILGVCKCLFGRVSDGDFGYVPWVSHMLTGLDLELLGEDGMVMF
jgi:hypothetical protein